MPLIVSHSSFPNSIWERFLFLAKFHFALIRRTECDGYPHQPGVIALRSAMEFPQQVRSQMEFGNERIEINGHEIER
jgi:hypothetical protein